MNYRLFSTIELFYVRFPQTSVQTRKCGIRCVLHSIAGTRNAKKKNSLPQNGARTENEITQTNLLILRVTLQTNLQTRYLLICLLT